MVLALVVLLGWALLSGDSDKPAADKQGSGSETPSQSPSPTEKKTEKKQEEKPTRAEMTAFVEDYLATVTSNPAQSWKMLTPQFQAESGGFGSYRGFWGGIESASPSAIRANPRDMTVSYSVTYQNAGRRHPDRRRHARSWWRRTASTSSPASSERRYSTVMRLVSALVPMPSPSDSSVSCTTRV